jgi:hypothetical protein
MGSSASSIVNCNPKRFDPPQSVKCRAKRVCDRTLGMPRDCTGYRSQEMNSPFDGRGIPYRPYSFRKIIIT